MIRLLRTTLRLGVLGGIGYRVWRTLRGRREADPWAGSWVSLDESGATGPATEVPQAPAPPAPDRVTAASTTPATTGVPDTNGETVPTPPASEESAAGNGRVSAEAAGTGAAADKPAKAGKGGAGGDGGNDGPGPSRPATTRVSKPSKTGPARKPPTGKAEEPPGERVWVAANDGVCPQSHPVKAKLSSKIFHLPGGRNYNRTHADRCYPDADSALADGLRRAQR